MYDHGGRGLPPSDADIEREGLALIVHSLVTDLYLAQEAQRDPARAKRMRALRDKAVTNFRAIYAAVIAAKELRAMTSDSRAATPLLSGCTMDTLNFAMAWQHALSRGGCGQACANCAVVEPSAASSGRAIDFKKCSKCSAIRYCSKQCQINHWPVHGPFMCKHYRWKLTGSDAEDCGF
ncbi:hypothetical protein FOA52_009904 [Chlamydomonas sp. UWO 241]|nr:hypothetical protein FOA52_009904 [Chlamydomonas sp. UWO 241]